ncbi:MAG TPA: hypothetical protein VMD91_18245 [Candidatus Sulfotelmatobacter sp.]|nr:hypothetical protein [Candidatus Sulfotelmatobacter sp.]
MADRRSFLGAVSGVATTLLLTGTADAQSTAAPTLPRPSASPAQPPSAVALAVAATMRRFDPHLSDAEIETIARGIDANAAGPVLNPHRATALRNADEPVTRFRVAGPR